eukprot:jgi/Tetstr1/420590/TSEL_011678.t1
MSPAVVVADQTKRQESPKMMVKKARADANPVDKISREGGVKKASSKPKSAALLALINAPAPSTTAVLPPPPFPLFVPAGGKENSPRSCTWRPRRVDTAALFQRPLIRL